MAFADQLTVALQAVAAGFGLAHRLLRDRPA
jgi:hypothetical protein